MSIHGVRMFTEPVFYRGRHGQESEEGKEDRQGSHQEGGKEDFKEKEVVVSATERLPPAGLRNPDAKRTCPIGSEMSFAAVSLARQGNIRPALCAASYCIKVRFFVSARRGHDLLLREASIPPLPATVTPRFSERMVFAAPQPSFAKVMEARRARREGKGTRRGAVIATPA